ncbi:MAG: response regulator transcription factor [Pirellulales bacterium]|nr:response regulator transcription factor [Pirellulales bacterium]
MSAGTHQILTVEDDAAIRRGIVDALRFAGYQPFEAATGDLGLRMATARGYDLLLLDLVLPGCHGLDILKAVHRIRPNQPVIILSALGDEQDRVAGLRLGADDYVVKPFSVKELLARVEAVLRRSPERPQELQTIEIPTGIIDLERAEIRYKNGERAELSEKELELIRYLAGNSGRAISRDELLQRVWQLSPRGLATRTIDMHVMRLREKLRDNSADPRIVLTVRGKGYMFAHVEGE